MYAIFILFNIDNKINTLFWGKAFYLTTDNNFFILLENKEKER
ncbi:hypothetical protein ASZ90_007376 [hydrocarbon metagenome]|uniref:Uncharacterized protein n=1 Tax=hydrocarbon metagenome TaxID=938273 RepID=A0A0W8FPP2_9ZZZZ